MGGGVAGGVIGGVAGGVFVGVCVGVCVGEGGEVPWVGGGGVAGGCAVEDGGVPAWVLASGTRRSVERTTSQPRYSQNARSPSQRIRQLPPVSQLRLWA